MEATLRAPGIPPPVRGWRMQQHEIDDNSEFIAECLRLWDQGCDTKDIATTLFQPESIVETAVRLGRERRRRMED
jgi:hypothetical protein